MIKHKSEGVIIDYFNLFNHPQPPLPSAGKLNPLNPFNLFNLPQPPSTFKTMSLELTINDNLKKAMLAKDEKGLRALRAIKAAILLAKTAEGAGETLSEDTEMKLLQKLVKQRRDSIDIFEQQNRADLAQKEKEEVEVIEQYLPKQLDPAELKTIVAAIISQLGVTSISGLGQVMGVASKQLAGKADGKAISAIVKELLTPQ